MVTEAREEGRSVVKIEIASSSAEPFWPKMGFIPVEDRQSEGGGVFAYRMLPHCFDLDAGERIAYAISFFTQREASVGMHDRKKALDFLYKTYKITDEQELSNGHAFT